MKLDFPREDIPTEVVAPHHKFLMDMHMHYQKMHMDGEISYIKYTGLSLFAVLGLIVLNRNGNYLLGIVIIGLGTLFVLAMNMIFISSDIDFKRSCYEKEGKRVEERRQSIVNFHYFSIVNAIKVPKYKVSVFTRLFPFAFVGSFTIWAGVALSMKISTHLAVLVGVFSPVILLISTFFLAKTIKKWQFFNLAGG